ncbi:type II secretion system protein GspM [Thauera aromatica]|nr:type II secretion system protein GspM [Thauera aromatica]
MNTFTDKHFPGRDARIVVGGSLLVLLLALAVIASFLIGRLNWAHDTLDSIEPRYARLLGLRELQPQLEAGMSEVAANLGRYAHPAAMDSARIGTDLQQRVRQIAETAGLGVVGSQILPSRTHAGFVQVPLKLTVDGNLEGLRGLLAAFEREVPIILVDKLQANATPQRQGRGQPPGEARLVVQIDLSVLHLQP